METAGITRRVAPLMQKLSGKLPSCPWRSILHGLDPRTLNGIPPAPQAELLRTEGNRELWRFDGRHEVWFPQGPQNAVSLWSEYLAVFWDHPVNGHRYHRSGTLVEKGDVCIDCGACEGFFALHALDLGAGQVICLEPFQRMADCLRATLASGLAAGRVTILEAALGAVNGEASFAADPTDFFAGKLGDGGDTSRSVTLLTLSQVCRQLGLERVDFIKMDIEGAELQALDGALPILQRDHPKLAITTYHRAFDFAALKTLLVSAGYDHIEPAGITDHFGEIFRPVMLHAWVNH